MTDEKTGPVCRWCQEPAERHLGKLKLCPTGGALSFHAFTPAKPEAKEAVRSHTEHLVIENWKLYEKAATERDAAIERAEKAEADAREFGGNAYRRLEARAENAENRNVNLQRCHCGQHSMERPDIHGINWYWSEHTREACTLELPNVRCWCGRLRSEHIDGHAAPVTPPAVDPRDVRIAELEQKLVAADVYGVELIRRIGERDARIAELETMLASTRETWNEQVQELEIDRDQQRARADAAEARCREVAREQREACSDYIAQSSDSVARHFSRVVRNTPLVTDTKEKSK